MGAVLARAEGPGLSRLADSLGVIHRPVAPVARVEAAIAVYRSLFDAMEAADPGAAAQAHALIAQLIAIAYRGRQSGGAAGPPCPADLLPAFQRIRLFYFEAIRVDELAALCGMSGSHFSRLFRAAFGVSPNTFLRRERINQAKRRLAESADPIKQIARQVGYGDHYFFSRDFKKVVGLTPRAFRVQERMQGPFGMA